MEGLTHMGETWTEAGERVGKLMLEAHGQEHSLEYVSRYIGRPESDPPHMDYRAAMTATIKAGLPTSKVSH